nr:glycosyltransferase family 9 protein [candidate division KSB1 bacterium]NIR68826.1 glycosyltransferase family 9 protein [candidate division KSB1 bacterium]NIS27189.1 glycosyltransferase family 9 protein [candidate division KSB1 bacterium]NIT74074.1 glycosyltransferase family 9 protein [candidate division KSB1 bacterium]NIU26939.1 glycosyltransferase family 9 protein [candidate division KSB1 bacterium]
MKAIKRLCNRIFFELLEKLLSKDEVSPDKLAGSDLERILIIRQHDRLEDLLLATPVFRAVRQRFPHAHISALVRNSMAPSVEQNVNLDQVICFYERLRDWTPKNIFVFLKKLRSKYDLAIVLNTRFHSLTSDLLAYFSGARFVLGSKHLLFPGCKNNFFYNLRAPYSDLNKHHTERNLDIVRHIHADCEELHEEIKISSEDKNSGLKFLTENGLNLDDLIVAIYLSWSNRREIAKLVQVARYFSSHLDAKIIVSWESEMSPWGAEFTNSLPFSPLQATELSLTQQLSLIYFCDLIICGDNVFMHLAAGIGTPLIAIFGESEPYQIKPIGQQFKAI